MRNLNTKTLVIVAAICLPSMSYAQCEPKKIQWGANCSVTTLSMTAGSTRDYSSDPFRDPATRLLKGVGSATLKCTEENDLNVLSSTCDAPPDALAQARVRESLPESVRNTSILSADELSAERLKRETQAKSILPESEQRFLATYEYVDQQSSVVLNQTQEYVNGQLTAVNADITNQVREEIQRPWTLDYVGMGRRFFWNKGKPQDFTGECKSVLAESVIVSNGSVLITYTDPETNNFVVSRKPAPIGNESVLLSPECKSLVVEQRAGFYGVSTDLNQSAQWLTPYLFGVKQTNRVCVSTEPVGTGPLSNC
jgi:hypothetical protein